MLLLISETILASSRTEHRYLHSLQFTSSVYFTILKTLCTIFVLFKDFVAFNRLFCSQHENIEEIMDTFNVIELRLCEYRMHSSFISITFMSEYRLRFIRKLSIIKHIGHNLRIHI